MFFEKNTESLDINVIVTKNRRTEPHITIKMIY